MLLVALAPSILYVGHWEPRFDIPFTSYYWGIPEDWGGHGENEDTSSHADHCHGDSSCAGKPVSAGATVALLREHVAYLGTFGLLAIVVGAWWSPRQRLTAGPETPPPRLLVVA